LGPYLWRLEGRSVNPILICSCDNVVEQCQTKQQKSLCFAACAKVIQCAARQSTLQCCCPTPRNGRRIWWRSPKEVLCRRWARRAWEPSSHMTLDTVRRHRRTVDPLFFFHCSGGSHVSRMMRDQDGQHEDQDGGQQSNAVSFHGFCICLIHGDSH
jgi:hypothetical protein